MGGIPAKSVTAEARHTEAATMLLNGLTVAAVAEQLGIARSTLYDWRRTPEFLAIHAQLSDDRIRRARTIIAGAGPKAARAIVGTIDSDDESIALNAAKDVLDRAGVLKGQRIETSANQAGASFDFSNMSDEELDALIQDAAIKEAEKRGRIIDD